MKETNLSLSEAAKKVDSLIKSSDYYIGFFTEMSSRLRQIKKEGDYTRGDNYVIMQNAIVALNVLGVSGRVMNGLYEDLFKQVTEDTKELDGVGNPFILIAKKLESFAAEHVQKITVDKPLHAVD